MQSISSASTSLTQGDTSARPLLGSARPKVNSILHLFGPWLFEAALIGSDTKPKKGLHNFPLFY